MAQPVPITEAAIGACMHCRVLFLATPETPNCLLCGRHPDYRLAFSEAYVEAIEEPEPPIEEPPPPAPAVEEPAPAAEEEAPALAVEEEEVEPEEGLRAIFELATYSGDYLAGAPIGPEELNGHFQELGADPEAAATAVRRLTAVRELLEELRQLSEPTPVQPE